MPLLLQMSGAVAGMAAFAFWPPAHGALLLVPLSGTAAGPINVALSAGAPLLAAGPLPGSVVVTGDRARIAAAAGEEGRTIIPLAAPAAICGPLPLPRALS